QPSRTRRHRSTPQRTTPQDPPMGYSRRTIQQACREHRMNPPGVLDGKTIREDGSRRMRRVMGPDDLREASDANLVVAIGRFRPEALEEAYRADGRPLRGLGH